MASMKWWYLKNFLSEEESEYFRKYLKLNKDNKLEDPVKQGKRKKCDVCVSRILDIRIDPNMHVLFKRLENVVGRANHKQFSVDINSLDNYSNIFLQEYKGNSSDHYGFHFDGEPEDVAGEQKLTCLINVSEKKSTGGEFVLFDGAECVVPELNEKGSILIFPSYHLHSVKPVKKGTRSVAAVWFLGPRWR
jgi:predicted 2-oxoglutarate/Fe(II)-dependent dioxygenase YbiX